MITGRSAAARMSSAWARAAGEGPGPSANSRVSGMRTLSSSMRAFSTSEGRSSSTGPLGPVVAMRIAWATRRGMSCTAATRWDHLVIGRAMAAWSIPACRVLVSASCVPAEPAR